jgi:hypothetical protein
MSRVASLSGDKRRNFSADQAIGDFFPHLDEVHWRYRL